MADTIPFTITPLQAGEQYPELGDIHACKDLPEWPFTPGINRSDGSGIEPYWTFPDGTPMKVLVRAPSFEEQREIEQEAGDDDAKHLIATVWRCLKAPQITRDEAVILNKKNPAALIQIYDLAWSLADYPAPLIAREVRRILGLQQPQSQSVEPVSGDSPA